MLGYAVPQQLVALLPGGTVAALPRPGRGKQGRRSACHMLSSVTSWVQGSGYLFVGLAAGSTLHWHGHCPPPHNSPGLRQAHMMRRGSAIGPSLCAGCLGCPSAVANVPEAAKAAPQQQGSRVLSCMDHAKSKVAAISMTISIQSGVTSSGVSNARSHRSKC